MGSTVPPKYFMPSAPVGSSPAANSLIPTQPGAQNPQQPQAPQQPQQSLIIPQGLNPFKTGGRFFAFLALLLLPLSAKATTTFTGTIQNLNTTNVTSGTYVRFFLRGCGGNQPRVSGTAVIAPTQGGVFFFDFIANGSGAVSGTLYSTRDSTGLLGGDITCGTSTTSVFYGMQIFVNGKGGPEVPIHAKNGVAFDISTVVLLSVTPAPNAAAPLTMTANIWTALQTFSAGLIINTSVGQGSGLKHQRFASPLGGTCPTATGVGNSCNSANLNWTTPFADNNYTVVCILDNPTNQPHISFIAKLGGGAGITITIATDTAAAANAGAECVAIHD